MKHLDLFSGIGGFALAARWVGWETVGFCEIDPYCQKVLRKHWPDVPIHGDIKTYEGQECDIITGGFPCQPYSVAGKQRGTEDDRDLWPEMFRIISESNPTWVVGENVAGFVNMELERSIADLEGIGYEVQSLIVPAVSVDAKHKRDRVWIIGHTNSTSKPDGPIYEKMAVMQSLAHSNSTQCERRRLSSETKEEHSDIGGGSRWKAEPRVDRVANGVSRRMDRLKGLGNAIVPQVAEVIFRSINLLPLPKP